MRSLQLRWFHVVKDSHVVETVKTQRRALNVARKALGSQPGPDVLILATDRPDADPFVVVPDVVASLHWAGDHREVAWS